MNGFKDFVELLKSTFKEWKDYEPFIRGATLAYYIIFSIGPLLVITTFILGLIFGRETAESKLISDIQNVAGKQLADTVQWVIKTVTDSPPKTITLIISAPILISGGTVLFIQSRRLLNEIWNAENKAAKGAKGVLRSYLYSLIMIFVIGTLFFLLIIKNFFIGDLSKFIFAGMSLPSFLVTVIDIFLSYILLSILFAMIYKILPAVTLKWKDVSIGALFSAFLFLTVQYLVGLYVTTTDLGNAYGAMGNFSIFVVWFFYSAIVFLFGAVFTKQYTLKYGSQKNKNG